MTVEATPTFPQEIESQYDAVLGNPDARKAKESLEQEGFTCFMKSDRFVISESALSGLGLREIPGFPQESIVLQPPTDEEPHWQLMNKFIPAGAPLHESGTQDAVSFREFVPLENHETTFFIRNSSGQDIVEIRFFPARKQVVCGVKNLKR